MKYQVSCRAQKIVVISNTIMKMTCYLAIERKKRSLLLWLHDKSCTFDSRKKY